MTSPERPILIAYDGSAGAAAAIGCAATLLRPTRALVVSVWLPVGSSAPAARIALPDDVIEGAVESIDAAAAQEAMKLAEQGVALARKGGLEATALPLRCEANVWATIVDAADEHDVAAVVVGSRGRSGIRAALLGSVSSGVAHHCRRPVLITRAG